MIKLRTILVFTILMTAAAVAFADALSHCLARASVSYNSALTSIEGDYQNALNADKTQYDQCSEFLGGILQTANPPLEMDLTRIFD